MLRDTQNYAVHVYTSSHTQLKFSAILPTPSHKTQLLHIQYHIKACQTGLTAAEISSQASMSPTIVIFSHILISRSSEASRLLVAQPSQFPPSLFGLTSHLQRASAPVHVDVSTPVRWWPHFRPVGPVHVQSTHICLYRTFSETQSLSPPLFLQMPLSYYSFINI